MKNALASLPIEAVSPSLPALIDRAVNALANARSAAEVLEARDLASVAYDIAKKTARLAKAKQAHDELLATAYRTQANALEIEASAKHRLADEYDAAQERGEVQAHGGQGKRDIPEQNIPPSVEDIGLTAKDIHEARIIRDAEKANPGVVRRAVDEALASGEEPTKARVRRAVLKVVQPDIVDDAPIESTPNSRFLNIAWDAEHRPSEFEFSSMTNFAQLAEAAERVSQSWAAAARELRRLDQS